MAEIWTMGELLVEMMRPRAGMELFETGEFIGPFPSGAPANFIDTVARLGHTAGIIGGVGDDDFGKCVTGRLKDDGVDCSLVEKFGNGTTAVAFVTYFADGSRKFLFHFPNTPAVWTKFPSNWTKPVPKYFHIMGCSLMADDSFREEIFKAVEFFSLKGTEITFDPNIRLELLKEKSLDDVIGPVLKKTSILFPGVSELKLITGENDIEKALAGLFKNPALKLVVLKKGKDGCKVISRETTVEVQAYKIEEVDPTGAGDFFDAGFLCGMLDNLPLEDCAKIAAASGAINASSFGPMGGNIDTRKVEKMMSGL
jgi:tagatose kinase